jgi:glycosyltransferase involved in cell wall biosynthesis
MSMLYSIIIPCYKQAHFLQQCLDSLLVQEYKNWEAIVINDGSPDNTNEVVQKYSAKDPRIKLVVKANGGLSSARNLGIANALGNRFIFLDADDYMYPNCLIETAKAFQNEDDKVLVQYGYTYVTEDKKSILHSVLPSGRKELIPKIFSEVLGPCHTICISKKMCDSVGFFDESLQSLEDWDFWLRAAKAGATQKVVSFPLVYYRYVRNSMSRNAFVMFDAYKKVAQRAILKDERIAENSLLNRNYDFNVKPVLQEALIRCLGVSIMQGEMDKSIALFQKESPKPITKYSPLEFESMCSYLSFRYWYSPSDIKNIFETIYPNFKVFFELIGYDKNEINTVLFYIFKRHYFYRNSNKYGKILGPFFNYILRLKFQK